MLVSISSPEVDAGAVLDYERELRNVLAAVRAARQGAAYVRVVEFASTSAIRAALAAEAFHVLHVSAHGRRVSWCWRTTTRPPVRSTPDTFVAEAIPAGSWPPMVPLAA